jgi:hypothetical protein
MKNKINKFICYLTGWLLTLFGITIGNISCVYGPAYDEEQFHKMKQLEEEVLNLEKKMEKIRDEKFNLMRDINKNENNIKYLERERDSLKILLENFEE